MHHIKRRTISLSLHPWLRQFTPRLSSFSTTTRDNNEDDKTSTKTPPAPPMIPKLKPNAVLKALASTVTESPKTKKKKLEHSFYMGRSMADPLAPVSRAKQMKYLMARDAGVKAAEYVIQQWPELFPSRDFSPDIRPKIRLKLDTDEDKLQYLISERNVDEALEIFDELDKEGKTVSLETQNSLLELLSYTGLGNETASDLSQFNEQQRMINEKDTLEFSCRGDTLNQRESNLQFQIDEKRFIVSAGSSYTGKNSKWTFKFPRSVWSPANDAERFFEKMEERNSDTYDALMVGLYKYKSYDRMFGLYHTMKEEGFKPSVSTYNLLLAALDDSECPHKWDIAMELVKCMVQEPTTHPSKTTFNMLLKLSEHSGSTSRKTAAAIFWEMLHVGIEPNLTTLLRLLQAYIYNNGDRAILYEVMDYLEEHPEVLKIESYFDIFFCVAVLNTACSLNDLDVARSIAKMASKDDWHLIGQVDHFLSHYMLTIAWLESDFNSVMETYRWLVPKHVRPGDWVYSTLFDICAKAKRPDVALDLWEDFKDNITYMKGISTIRLFHLALGKLTKSNIQIYTVVAEESWEMLLSRNMRPDTIIIESMVRLFSFALQMDKAWYYYEQFKEYGLKPTNFATRQIANAYAFGYQDSKRVEEMYRILIKDGEVLPTNFAKVCAICKIPHDVRRDLAMGFKNNKTVVQHDTNVSIK